MSQLAGADIIVVAAGRSRRMGGSDKLNEPVLGRPLLAWTLANMALARCLRRLVVVVAAENVERTRRASWLPAQQTHVLAGGETRSDSVRAGLEASQADVVLVHDGARPLAGPELADAVAGAAAEHGAAIPVIDVVDSLKRADGGWLRQAVDRQGMVRAQTPQGARRDLLVKAFAAEGGTAFSDEASLLQARGMPVATVPGDALNLKVTEPHDLELIRAVLKARAGHAATRQGIGTDSHPFGPDDGLRLGGLLIEEAPRLHGHSDGDVALHALASAMLSAAGMGDLGRHFPPSDPATSGVASTRLLSQAVELVARTGWRPAAAQLSLIGARPRLGAARLEKMRRTMAELLGVAPEAFALSASSGNLAGPEGAGRSISASAVVNLVRR